MRCVPQVLDIQAKAKIMFRLTLSTTYEKRSVDIHLGDFIDKLVYQEGDNLREISGVVHSINTFERALPRSSYDSPDYISLRNVIESITLDVSYRYKSELVTVDIVDIRNYDMVIHNTLDIKDLEVVNKNKIQFYSETKPIAFVWNGETYPIEPIETFDFTYEVKVNDMYMKNNLVIFDDSGSIFKTVINGLGMDVVSENTLKNEIKDTVHIFCDRFFDKYNATDLTDLIGDTIYVPIIKDIGNVEAFNVNGITYYNDELPSVTVSIPNREPSIKTETTAMMYPFKFVDDNLCICAPIISHYLDDEGRLTISVNGYEQSWEVSPFRSTLIDIKDVIPVNVPSGYAPTIVDVDGSEISITRKHLSTYPAIYYSSKRANEINHGMMCIKMSEDSGWSYKYKLIDASTLRSKEKVESVYIPEKFLENSPVYVDETRVFNYSVYIFGEGYITFNINLIDKSK